MIGVSSLKSFPFTYFVHDLGNILIFNKNICVNFLFITNLSSHLWNEQIGTIITFKV